MSARTFGQKQICRIGLRPYSAYGEEDEREDTKCVAEALRLCAPPKAGLRETDTFKDQRFIHVSQQR